jgi:hypothetical protein
MASKKNDFMDILEDVIEPTKTIEDTPKTEEYNTPKLIIKNKVTDKTKKMSFPLYLESEKIKALDKICKRTGHSRNEIINMFIDFCLSNYEFEK